MISRVLILFMMENFKEEGVVYEPKICYDVKNPIQRLLIFMKIVMFKQNVILKRILGFLRSLVKSLDNLTKDLGRKSLPRSNTFNIEKRMVKNEILTIHIDAKGFGVLITKILDTFKLNTQVFHGDKEKYQMSQMMKNMNLTTL